MDEELIAKEFKHKVLVDNFKRYFDTLEKPGKSLLRIVAGEKHNYCTIH